MSLLGDTHAHTYFQAPKFLLRATWGPSLLSSPPTQREPISKRSPDALGSDNTLCPPCASRERQETWEPLAHSAGSCQSRLPRP